MPKTESSTTFKHSNAEKSRWLQNLKNKKYKNKYGEPFTSLSEAIRYYLDR